MLSLLTKNSNTDLGRNLPAESQAEGGAGPDQEQDQDDPMVGGAGGLRREGAEYAVADWADVGKLK